MRNDKKNLYIKMHLALHSRNHVHRYLDGHLVGWPVKEQLSNRGLKQWRPGAGMEYNNMLHGLRRYDRDRSSYTS